jgi:hypothetical protein
MHGVCVGINAESDCVCMWFAALLARLPCHVSSHARMCAALCCESQHTTRSPLREGRNINGVDTQRAALHLLPRTLWPSFKDIRFAWCVCFSVRLSDQFTLLQWHVCRTLPIFLFCVRLTRRYASLGCSLTRRTGQTSPTGSLVSLFSFCAGQVCHCGPPPCAALYRANNVIPSLPCCVQHITS